MSFLDILIVGIGSSFVFLTVATIFDNFFENILEREEIIFPIIVTALIMLIYVYFIFYRL